MGQLTGRTGAPRLVGTGTVDRLKASGMTASTATASYDLTVPPDAPGVMIAQHMPPGFTKSFAQRLNGLCRIAVKEAEHGERVLPGHAYIAPGDAHLVLVRSGANYVAHLSDAPPVNRHRPSVDVLFRSAAQNARAVSASAATRAIAAGPQPQPPST